MKRTLTFLTLVVALVIPAAMSAPSASAAIAPVVCGPCDGGGGRPNCDWSNFGMWYGNQWCGLYYQEYGAGIGPYWHY